MITVILTSYKRPYCLQEQIDAIKAQTVAPKDIMLWHNESGTPFTPRNDIKTIVCNHNFKFHGRFTLALLARTEYIAIFDDDTIPGKKWFESCLETMKTHPGILGATGVYCKDETYFNMVPVGWQHWSVHKNVPQEVDLIGHAWFFKKEWLKYMFYEEPVTWDNGEDIQFAYSAQKYGGINSYVPPHPYENQEIWGSHGEKGMQYGTDNNAFSMTIEPNKNIAERNGLVKEYINRGWKTCKMRGITV